MIQLQNVTKLYGTVIGVNDITLSLKPGAYGLVGPNGSGKTTLLNLITGQLRPTIGQVNVMGASPWRQDGLLRAIGLCPAVDVLYPNVSAVEWVSYLVELYGFGRHEARLRAADSLRRFGMGDSMHLAMGTYCAHDPSLLILDEPFNGLDPIGRHEMTEVLKKWVRDGKSLILSSHILHEVEAVSPSFLLIRGGRVLASGPPEEIHALLADVPNEIHIRCDQTTVLGRQFVESGLVEWLRFVDDGQAIQLATRNPMAIFEQLPAWLATLGVRVHEMRSADDSLQRLFTSLMRMHRGEKS